MAEEDDYLPLSALQHMVFCDRQAALIHLERIWIENARTVQGSDLHRAVDEGVAEKRGEVLIRRGLTLRSERLRVTGRADVVEFHRVPEGAGWGCRLHGHPYLWRPIPVEYKRGRPKEHRADEVQLCAQAICLEDAFGVSVQAGALFYGQTRRRQAVVFDESLRRLTENTAESLHKMIASGRTPVRSRQKKCDLCSLLPACLPPSRSRMSVEAYLRRGLAFSEPDPEAQ